MVDCLQVVACQTRCTVSAAVLVAGRSHQRSFGEGAPGSASPTQGYRSAEFIHVGDPHWDDFTSHLSTCMNFT